MLLRAEARTLHDHTTAHTGSHHLFTSTVAFAARTTPASFSPTSKWPTASQVLPNSRARWSWYQLYILRVEIHHHPKVTLYERLSIPKICKLLINKTNYKSKDEPHPARPQGRSRARTGARGPSANWQTSVQTSQYMIIYIYASSVVRSQPSLRSQPLIKACDRSQQLRLAIAAAN